MKITGLVLIILGSLMIFFNLIAYLGATEKNVPPETVNRTAYYIGFNALLIAGTLFLLIGILLHKKAKRIRRKNDLLGNFLEETSQGKEV